MTDSIGKILQAVRDNADGRRIDLAEIESDGRRSPANRDKARAKVEAERDAKHTELIAKLGNAEAVGELRRLLDGVHAGFSQVGTDLGALATATIGGSEQPDVLAGLLGRRELLRLQETSLVRLLTDALPLAAAKHAAGALEAYNAFMAVEIGPRSKERDRLDEEIRHIQSGGTNLFTGMTAARSPSPRLSEIPALKGKRVMLQAELEQLGDQMRNLDGAARYARAREREVRSLVARGQPETAARLLLNGRTSRNAHSRSQKQEAPADG